MSAFNSDPVEAIRFIRDKLDVPSASWTDLWQQQHSVAFTVAGAQSEALVRDFHDAVNRAIANGTTLDDFRRDFDRIVAEHGWSYNGSRGWRSAILGILAASVALTVIVVILGASLVANALPAERLVLSLHRAKP